MEITKIFIAAQPDNLKSDISELGLFFLNINNCYVSKGHYFTPILNDTISDDATGDTENTDCALAFFLTRPGSELPDTYKAALNSYNKTGKPKISVYIKNTGDEKPLLPATIEYSLNTNNYDHLDTLKLEILMQIKQLNLDGVDIHLEDGKAWQGNTVLLSLENVEAVSGYENLQNLKQKRAELESRYYAAKTRHAENPDDSDAYEAFFEASKQRGEAIQEIRDVEAQLFHMMEGMYEQTSHGKLTTRQAEGYRLIERGLLNEARAVLDFDAIISESRHHEELAEQAAKRAQDSVNELMQLKDVNATLLDWDAVDACYREAVRLEEKYNLPRIATMLYIEFVFLQNRHSDAAIAGESLMQYFNTPGSCATDEEKSFLYNLLGIIYYDSQRMDESERMLKESLRIRRARVTGPSDVIDKEIAIVYNGLGLLYFHQNRYSEAIEAHNSALDIRKKLATHNPDAHIEYLAYTYINLGAVYNETEAYNESIEIMAAARDIFKDLSKNKPEPHEQYLSACLSNLGISYTKLSCFDEAEEFLKEALEIMRKWADYNPNAHEPRLAQCFYGIAQTYLEENRYADAEENYKKALEIYSRLAERTPDAFEPPLADCKVDLAEVFARTERFMEAETALKDAIIKYDKYAGVNLACAEKTIEAGERLNSIQESHRLAGGAFSQLTPEEKEIVLLIINGDTKHDVARKLHLSASDAADRLDVIREKVIGKGEPNPVIVAVVAKYGLSQRQTEMIRCLSLNMSNAEIAAELCLAEENVKVHIHNLIKKLPVANRTEIPLWLDAFRG